GLLGTGPARRHRVNVCFVPPQLSPAAVLLLGDEAARLGSSGLRHGRPIGMGDRIGATPFPAQIISVGQWGDIHSGPWPRPGQISRLRILEAHGPL
ncbi:MAG: hypothetical protein V2I76_12030, partial [Roseobacter sp.]|nr:hypothetical protein [Roseobacter sp.]